MAHQWGSVTCQWDGDDFRPCLVPVWSGEADTKAPVEPEKPRACGSFRLKRDEPERLCRHLATDITKPTVHKLIPSLTCSEGAQPVWGERLRVVGRLLAGHAASKQRLKNLAFCA